MIHSIWTRAALGLMAFACVETSFAADTLKGGGTALHRYVQTPDTHYNWKKTQSKKFEGGTVAHLELLSQFWREQFWSHDMQVVRPTEMRNPDICLLFVTGSGDGVRYIEMLQTIANRSGAMAVVLTDVPNQPLYDGKNEDALIAYTFEMYSRTKDESWPLLFPMVKSAVRAMDAIQEFARKEGNQNVQKFVVCGASKRGWTTWLTSAVDKRVVAMAPMVIDVLNFKAQMEWSKAMYGRQSEQIKDYEDYNLVERLNSPELAQLTQWVDPYNHISSFDIPKLILLGTNDRYWVVDSLRHYYNELPGPKWIFQTPNAGHDLNGGKEAIPVLASWYQMIADGEKPATLTFKFENAGDNAKVNLQTTEKPVSLRLWTSDSPDRDLRDDKWVSKEIPVTGDSNFTVDVPKPASGYRAYMIEGTFKSDRGHEYKLSTEARVVPDTKPALPKKS